DLCRAWDAISSSSGRTSATTRPTSRARRRPRTPSRTSSLARDARRTEPERTAMATITGSEVLATALRTQGVDTMFYLMGGPMLETEAACIQLGIRAIDHRHEQAASFAAHAYTRVMRRPGPVYIDMPGDVLGEKVEEDAVKYAPAWKPTPRTLGDPAAVKEAIALLAKAERPMLIAGSGVWWSDGAAALQAFVEATGIPFYTKPISRGLIPEDHALSFLNARSKAFTEADVVLAVGTRFDWMIQFGRPPRFAADLKVIHVDVNPTQLGHNRAVDVPIVGDARAVLAQLHAEAQGKINPKTYASWTGKLRTLLI